MCIMTEFGGPSNAESGTVKDSAGCGNSFWH